MFSEKEQMSKNNYVLRQCGRILHIFEPIYRINYYFVTAKNWIDARKFIESHFMVKLERDLKERSGYFCILNKNKTECGVIWAVKNDYPYLAHEILHAVCWSMDRVGIKLSAESEEAYTYLHTFLMRSILKGDISVLRSK